MVGDGGVAGVEVVAAEAGNRLKAKPLTNGKLLKILLAVRAELATFTSPFLDDNFMARFCELTGKGPIKGSHIWRSGKAKKKGGIGTHVTAITKRRFLPNLQRVKAVINGEVRYVRVAASAIKKGLVTKAPRRTWKKETAEKKAA
jgi:large subunit ribosomal protein L28